MKDWPATATVFPGAANVPLADDAAGVGFPHIHAHLFAACWAREILANVLVELSHLQRGSGRARSVLGSDITE